MNMRQKLRCILTIMGIITVCTACIVQKDPVDNSDDSGTKKKSFGKYDIMKGWSESDYSRDEKYVYVKKGTDNKDEFNNFVVGAGESDYSEEEYEQFEKAILQQLSSKIGQLDNATLKGTAGTTDQGYTLLTFAITESNGTVTTQYYIIGEKKYCLIQETNYDKSEECDDATMEAVNRFTWWRFNDVSASDSLICFSCPCSYDVGAVLTEPLECLNTDNIILCETKDNIIEKIEGEFKYKLSGKLIDMQNGIVEVKGFNLHIDEDKIPKDMSNGMCIQFEVSRIDIW